VQVYGRRKASVTHKSYRVRFTPIKRLKNEFPFQFSPFAVDLIKLFAAAFDKFVNEDCASCKCMSVISFNLKT